MRQHKHINSILRAIHAAVMFAALCLSGVVRAEHFHIVIIASENSFQQKIATNLKQSLSSEHASVDLLLPEEINKNMHTKQTLFITIGETAIKSHLEQNKNENALRLLTNSIPGINNTSAQANLMITQPACRQIHLIKALAQDWTSLAVLASAKSAEITAELTRCAIKHDINLRIYAITDESDLLKTLDDAMNENDVLLAIPDQAIYNSKSVKTILLSAYRKRIPVIGYSRSFVQSGAIAAVYSSAESISDTATNVVNAFFQNNWQFRHNTNYPEDFSVTTNNKVAKSLGLKLPDDLVIEQYIERKEDE